MSRAALCVWAVAVLAVPFARRRCAGSGRPPQRRSVTPRLCVISAHHHHVINQLTIIHAINDVACGTTTHAYHTMHSLPRGHEHRVARHTCMAARGVAFWWERALQRGTILLHCGGLGVVRHAGGTHDGPKQPKDMRCHATSCTRRLSTGQRTDERTWLPRPRPCVTPPT